MTPWDWDGWKVVAVDVETTGHAGDQPTPDNPHDFHIVDIGAVTLRHGRVTSRWGELVNPGVAIDNVSYAVHGINERDIEHASVFPDIEPALTRILTPDNPDQQVIVIAHKTSFDIPIIRAAYQRIGLHIPDVALIDTLEDLPTLVGVDHRRSGRSLAKTARALNVPTNDLHTASGDAQVTALIFLRMLDLATEVGHSNFPSLLASLPPDRSSDIGADLPTWGSPR